MALMQRDGGGALARPESSFVPLSQAISRLFQDSFLLPSFFEGFGSWFGGTVGTNLWETGDSYVVQVAMPGMKADSIEATVEQNVLTVKGEPSLQAPENATAIWQSFGGQSEYRVQLPAEVEPGAAEASYEGGVLTVRLPKPAHTQARTIKVTAR